MSAMIESLNMTGNTRQYAERVAEEKRPAVIAGASLQFVVHNSSIDIRLSNDIAISALRFEIVFQKKLSYRAPDLNPRIQGLNNYINLQDNVITFVLLDLDGKGIEPGQGTIIKVPFDGDQQFEITAVYASTRSTGILEMGYTITKESLDEETLILEQNDPNPFSGRTRLDFRITSDADTKLMIYDVGGALIRTLVDTKLKAGMHSAEWDGCSDSGQQVEAGIYLYKLYAGVYSVTRKMVFLK